MNWKYLLFDVIKFVLPIVVAQFIPESAPQAEIATTALYLFAVALGVDSGKKIYNSVKPE